MSSIVICLFKKYAWLIICQHAHTLTISFMLQIHDGRNTADHLIGRFCGNTFPRGGNFLSTTNYLYIWFRTDHTIAHQGFSLHWVSANPICGGIIKSSTYGTISSPGAPGKYPQNRDCYWTITTSSSKRIQINFFTLQIESHPDCKYDFLEVSCYKCLP